MRSTGLPTSRWPAAGSLYWDVLSLFNQIKKGIALAAQRYTVKSLAIDTWGVDFGLLDKSGPAD